MDEVSSKTRPQSLAEILGQERIKSTVNVFVEAAKKQNKALSHTLITGPSGLGKTTFANAIAHDLGRHITITMGSGASLEDLSSVMSNEFQEQNHPIWFIDEIHLLPKEFITELYALMEDFIYFGVMEVKPFTLIGATTDPGKLPGPFIQRFQNRYMLDFYSNEEIVQIVRRNVSMLFSGVIQDEACLEIAKRSRGVPRIANNLIAQALDFASVLEKGFTVELVNIAMDAVGVGENGLTQIDVDYILALLTRFGGGPAGVNAIASSLGESAKNIEADVEPWLLREGYIQRQPRGRKLSAKGLYAAAKLIKDRA